MSVNVAVRVRPFNIREKNLGAKLCVKMVNNTTVLYDSNDKERSFNFDHSFWSHDGFEIDENGYSYAVDDQYTDQKKVYDRIGAQVLNNAFEGYHCCLFAYGQTGSGKSYSMIGYGPNKGIVPIISEEIFKKTKLNTNELLSYEVNISMIEIYNEKIQDLLIPFNERVSSGLKVRENKLMGIYVEGLSKYEVKSYTQIEEKMNEGNKNRTIASTQMNASSSRAHTIITIEFKQKEIISGKKTEKLSVINLVDLAGSEKVSKTGAKGDRLKEGCSINKSLTTLGLVISTLAEKSMGKAKNSVVPFRNSCLTRILQNALGGNSKTLMICAISPSLDNYEESLSTLRYADQAKKIKCKAIINESDTDKMIRLLREENLKLKSIIQQIQKNNPQNLEIGQLINIIDKNEQKIKDIPEDEKEEDNLKENNIEKEKEILLKKEEEEEEEEDKEKLELKKKIEEQNKKLEINDMLIKEYEKNLENKMEESSEPEKENIEIPHITNLNEDHMLSKNIIYNFDENNEIFINKGKSSTITNGIINLLGIYIKEEHAKIYKENEEYYIEPISIEAIDYLFLNGKKITNKTQIYNLDRIIIGKNSFFLFINPINTIQSENNNHNKELVDWEFCQTEFENNEEKEVIKDQEKLKNYEEKIKIIENKIEKEKLKVEEEKENLIKNYEDKIVSIQNDFKQNINQDLSLFLDYQKIIEENNDLNENEEDKKLETKKHNEINEIFFNNKKYEIKDIMNEVNEFNLILKDLKVNVIIELKINIEDNVKNYNLKFKVINTIDNDYYYINIDNFYDLLEKGQNILEEFYMNDKIKIPNIFEFNKMDKVIGFSMYLLKPLLYFINNPIETNIIKEELEKHDIEEEKKIIGTINIDIVPGDDDGNIYDIENLEEDIIIEEVTDLLFKKLYYFLNIDKIILKDLEIKKIKLKYTLKEFNKETKNLQNIEFESEEFNSEKEGIFELNYSKRHEFKFITKEIIEYLMNSNLKISVVEIK